MMLTRSSPKCCVDASGHRDIVILWRHSSNAEANYTNHSSIAEGCFAINSGGARGIGLAAARRFGGAGMRVVLLDLPGPALDAASAELAADGLAVTALPTDVTQRAQIAAAKTQVARLGPVSVLMCNAGREGGGRILADENVWRGILETNLSKSCTARRFPVRR